MFRSSAALIALMFMAGSLGAPAQAANNCARETGGKCKVGETVAPKRTKSGAVTHQATRPMPKGNHKGRDEYTPAQREKMMEQARQLCRTKYGAPSRVYRIDYKRNTVWCEPPAY